MVQARWGFRNAEHSWLTGVQALLLGPHFGIEHQVRFSRGLFFNFNGTAGVWRREAIESAGGWQADTVTEDLDLSYRAQLAGWRFVYLSRYFVPSELPVTLSAFRGQQQRWAKGSIQTARKILPKLLGETLPLPVKCEALAHLLANFCWLIGALVFLTLYPTVVSRVGVGPWQILRLDVPLFLATSVAILTYFFMFLHGERQTGSVYRLLLLPVISIGLAPSIALSVLRGVWSKGGIFERTPKFGIVGRASLPVQSFLYRRTDLSYLFLNTILFCYSLLPVAFACQRSTWYALPFFALFPSGFLYVLILEIREALVQSGEQAEVRD
jgi:cellulose synthase/poly-beta-1,6-N-acetylglucosamine synthase-like glycosyltransferase